MVLHVRACVAGSQTNIGHRNEISRPMLKKERTEKAKEMSCFVSREGLSFGSSL